MNIVSEHICDTTEIMEISTPMTRDKQILEKEWLAGAQKIAQKLQQGKNVAFITLVGIGTSYVDITESIRHACHKIGHSVSSIAIIGSTELKSAERGLAQAARHLNKKQIFFTNLKLQECIEKNDLKNSTFVKTQMGVGNKCEAAAILAGKSDKLILKKTIFPKITGNSQGKIAVVGIGPGNLDEMTPRALTAIIEAEVIIGYDKYLKLITTKLEFKKIISSAMLQEVERCEAAVQEAQHGG